MTDLLKVIFGITVFSFLSIIFLTIYVVEYGTINDYILFPLQNVSNQLMDSGIISAETNQLTYDTASGFRQTITAIDYLWLLVYLLFFASTISFSYMSAQQSHFGFLASLFWVFMASLFILSVIAQITGWWQVNILEKILPGVSAQLPIFTFYLSYIGIFVGVQIAVCLLANALDLDLSNFFRRKKKEEEIQQDSELL